MTLLVTELGPTGIIMASDERITFKDGKCESVEGKVLLAENACALIGYWGNFGQITNDTDFAPWLGERIRNIGSVSLITLAERLCAMLEAAPKINKIGPMGLHVAGYASGPDDTYGPTVFHVRNNRNETPEGIVDVNSQGVTSFATGSHLVSPAQLRTEQPYYTPLATFERVYPAGAVGPFECFQDFPAIGESATPQESVLPGHFLLRNGDLLVHELVAGKMREAFASLSTITGFAFPADDSLLSRAAYLRLLMDTSIRAIEIGKVRARTIGGQVWMHSITPDGVYAQLAP